jgi:hypothetical protein
MPIAGTATETGGEAVSSNGPGAGAGELSVSVVGPALTGAVLLDGAAVDAAGIGAELEIVDEGVELMAVGWLADDPSPAAVAPPALQPATPNRMAPTMNIRPNRLPGVPAEFLGVGGIDFFLSNGHFGWKRRRAR